MIFTAAMYPPGQERVENGTLGTVLDASGEANHEHVHDRELARESYEQPSDRLSEGAGIARESAEQPDRDQDPERETE